MRPRALRADSIAIEMFDIAGPQCGGQDPRGAGHGEIAWDAGRLAAGVYHARLTAAGERAVARLGVSTRKIQRMEESGKLTRCRGMGTVVRYAASDVQPYGFVCRLALGTGLRWGELSRAQASEVKRFRASGSVEDQWFLDVSHTKSRRIRRVPLPPDLVREVPGHIGRLVQYAAGSPGSFAGAVRKLSGIEGFHVHQMRHTFACQWLERGGSLAALQQVLGHASIVTTQRYARLTDEAVMREARRVHDVQG